MAKYIEREALIEWLKRIKLIDLSDNFIKSEAIKEFAERLVYTLCINNEENTEIFDYAYTLETIDNLVKEMVGDGLDG